MTPLKPTQVVAGIIVKGDAILLGKRLSSGKYPHQWEFPGGKVEPEEKPTKALKRELKEELGIDVRIGGKIISYNYSYPNRHEVQLSFYLITDFTPEPQKLHYNEFMWVPLQNLFDYDILDGSRPVVEYLLSHAEEIFHAS